MIAITGGKGGVGKTTTALGLAQALGKPTQPMTVVDLDVEMPDLHLYAMVDRQPTLEALAAGRNYTRVTQTPAQGDHLRVIPAPTYGHRETIEPGLKRLPAQSTILDCPGGAGPDVTQPLEQADSTVIVTRPGTESIEDGKKTAAMAAALGTPITAVVIIGATEVPPAARQIESEIHHPVPAAHTQPLHDSAVQEAYRQLAQRL